MPPVLIDHQHPPRGVDLVAPGQGTGTSTAAGRMFFQILGAIAESGHALMSERTLDGLAAARVRGSTGGQKPKLTPRQARITRQIYEKTGSGPHFGLLREFCDGGYAG